MAKGKAEKREPDYRGKLERLLEGMNGSEALLSEKIGVSVQTVRGYLRGKRPSRLAAKVIDLLGRVHGRAARSVWRASSLWAERTKAVDPGYYGYLLLWRRYIKARLAVSAPLEYGYLADEVEEEAQHGGQPDVTMSAPATKDGRFPLDVVALRHGLDEGEKAILAALLVEELDTGKQEQACPQHARPSVEPTGRVLVLVACDSAMEMAARTALVQPEGKLRSLGLVESLDDAKSLLSSTFRLTRSAREELISGLPAVLVRKESACDLCSVIRPAVDFDKVVLPSETMEQLKQAAAMAVHRDVLWRDWGFGKVIRYGRGLGLLFWGPPGTGKTLAAEALAAALGKDLWVAELSRVEGMYVGQTEKRIVRVFREAQEAGAVLLVDEADGLFASREMAVRTWELSRASVLLREMERYTGVVILTTNNEPVLDKALDRRLAMKVEFPRPGRREREAIWRLHVPEEAPLDGVIDFGALAELDLSGGQIKQAVIAAAGRALRRGGPEGKIGQADLEAAARGLVAATPSIGFGRAGHGAAEACGASGEQSAETKA